MRITCQIGQPKKTWLICKCKWRIRKHWLLAIVTKTCAHRTRVLHHSAGVWVRGWEASAQVHCNTVARPKGERRTRYVKTRDRMRNLEMKENNWAKNIKCLIKRMFLKIFICLHMTFPYTVFGKRGSRGCSALNVHTFTSHSDTDLGSEMCIVT